MPPRPRSFEETAHRRRFGDRVRQLRLDRGWSQELLAEKAQLHRTYVVEVERGHRNASLDVIQALATALSVPPATLFQDDDTPGVAGQRWD
jgi:transcriptional regulator with XRE-family HTH domain